jgi:hypothetical protein
VIEILLTAGYQTLLCIAAILVSGILTFWGVVGWGLLQPREKILIILGTPIAVILTILTCAIFC